MLDKKKSQKICALGSVLGIFESGNKNDDLHTLVYGMTGKESIKQLTDEEYKTVIKELHGRLRITQQNLPPRKPYKTQKYQNSGRGKMSDGQKRKVWRLMYILEGYDITPSSSDLGRRLCGIIKKELKVDSLSENPFEWLSYQQGVKLIEIIKKYCENAEKRRKECDSG